MTFCYKKHILFILLIQEVLYIAKKGGSGYFGLGFVPSLILAIIPITSWILGVLTAAKNKSWLWVIIRLFLGFNIIWVIDLISMILNKQIKWLV